METSLTLPDNRELEEAKLFKNSIFPADLQTDFVVVIRSNASSALGENSVDPSKKNKRHKFALLETKSEDPNRFYLVNSHRRYEGSVNVPFTITVNDKAFSPGEYYKVGPVDINLACSLAYLEQENAAILIDGASNEAVRQIPDVEFTQAFAQGLSTIVSHLGNSRKEYPRLDLPRYIKAVLENSRSRFVSDIVKYKENLDFYQREFSFSKGDLSRAKNEYQETLDRLKGFDKGQSLVEELVNFNWNL